MSCLPGKKLCLILFSPKTVKINKKLIFNLRNLIRFHLSYSTKMKINVRTHHSTLYSDYILAAWNLNVLWHLLRSGKDLSVCSMKQIININSVRLEKERKKTKEIKINLINLTINSMFLQSFIFKFLLKHGLIIKSMCQYACTHVPLNMQYNFTQFSSHSQQHALLFGQP